MKKSLAACLLFLSSVSMICSSCNRTNKIPSDEAITAMNFKRGEIALCGISDKKLGTVDFVTSCSQETKGDFDLAIALLHSFEYGDAEKVFAKIIDKNPNVQWPIGV
ncbi:MAG: hypothetical protein JWQ25_1443 [Daejeonella sp.]|nr:hypothetical protein [Daejeonella sp.]